NDLWRGCDGENVRSPEGDCERTRSCRAPARIVARLLNRQESVSALTNFGFTQGLAHRRNCETRSSEGPLPRGEGARSAGEGQKPQRFVARPSLGLRPPSPRGRGPSLQRV